MEDTAPYSGPFHDVPDREMIVVQSWAEVPQFTSDEAEAVFWDTHTLADHLWSKRRGPRSGSLAARLAAQHRHTGR